MAPDNRINENNHWLDSNPSLGNYLVEWRVPGLSAV